MNNDNAVNSKKEQTDEKIATLSKELSQIKETYNDTKKFEAVSFVNNLKELLNECYEAQRHDDIETYMVDAYNFIMNVNESCADKKEYIECISGFAQLCFEYCYELEAEEFFKKEIKLRKSILNSDDTDEIEKIATCYRMIGEIYEYADCDSLALKYYEKAIKFLNKYVKKGNMYLSDALLENEFWLADLYRLSGHKSKANAIYKRILLTNPVEMHCDESILIILAKCYYQLAKTRKNSRAAEYCYSKAIEIFESLEFCEREEYEEYYAWCLSDFGSYYALNSNQEKAEEYFKRAVDELEKVYEHNREFIAYFDLLKNYYFYTVNYTKGSDSEDLLECYKRIVELCQQDDEHCKNDSIELDMRLKLVLHNAWFYLGVIRYNDSSQRSQSREYFVKLKEAFEHIDKDMLTNEHILLFADAYRYLMMLCAYEKNHKQSEFYFNKSAEVFNTLALKNKDTYTPYLAVLYYNYGYAKPDMEYVRKAYKLAQVYSESYVSQKLLSSIDKRYPEGIE